MVYYIGVTVLVVLLGLLVKENSIYAGKCCVRQSHINRTAVFGVFCILTFLSGTRLAVGNDFWVYRENFILIAQDRVVASELGFNIIVKLVQWFAGFDNYMPVFFVFSLLTCMFFVLALKEQSEWFAASLFLLLANGFYFSSLNTVRYYLAFAIALYSLRLVWQNKHLQFIGLILLAATIHKTVLVVIPCYYLAKVKYSRKFIPIVVLGSVTLLLLRDFVREAMFLIYPFYRDSYLDDYAISYVNIMKAAAVLIFCLIYYKSGIKNKPCNQFLFNLNVGALIVFSCLWYLPESTRIGYYFSASNIFLLPAVIKSIENRKQRIFFTIVIGLAYAVFFLFYLRTLSATDIRILPYRNWFFAC